MADVAAEVAKSFFQFGFENKDYELILELFEVFFMCAAYISSDQPDVTKKKKISGRYHHQSENGKLRKTSVQNWDVGYWIVQERTETARVKTFSNDSKISSYHVCLHMQKAHWHTYWTGQGRTISKIRWIHDTDVNKNLGDSTTVVHLIN